MCPAKRLTLLILDAHLGKVMSQCSIVSLNVPENFDKSLAGAVPKVLKRASDMKALNFLKVNDFTQNAHKLRAL